jgi:hypothetical protein
MDKIEIVKSEFGWQVLKNGKAVWLDEFAGSLAPTQGAAVKAATRINMVTHKVHAEEVHASGAVVREIELDPAYTGEELEAIENHEFVRED